MHMLRYRVTNLLRPQVCACGPGYGGRLGLGPGNKDVLFPTLVNTGNDLEVLLRRC